MKKRGTNLIPQKIIEDKDLTVQGKPEIFIRINEFLAQYDDKKINKIVFLGGSRKDLRIISQYMFFKRIGNEILLLERETQIYREVDCSTETSEKLWPQLAINWLKTKSFLLDFYSYYHNKLKEDRWFSGTDSHEWTKLREYFSKHYLSLIDCLSNSQKLYSDSKIIFNGIQRFEMSNIKENVARVHKSILERYKYKATTDVYYKLIEAIYYIKKNECLLLWNISRKNKQLLFNLILGLGNLSTMPITHKMLSSISIQQTLTSAPNLLIVQFKNADEFDEMPKQIKNFLQEFEIIDLEAGQTSAKKEQKEKTNVAPIKEVEPEEDQVSKPVELETAKPNEQQEDVKSKGLIEKTTKQTPEYVFKKQGDYIKIIYEGQELTPIKAYIGLIYIAHLLYNPKSTYTPLSLSQLRTKSGFSKQQIAYHSMNKKDLENEGLTVSKRRSRFKEMLDVATTKQLKSTRKELENVRKQAEVDDDIDSKLDCEESIKKIDRELKNRKKTFQDPGLKKINDSVKKAIDESIEKIKNISEPLYEHLKVHIKKDKSGYRYEPPKPIVWHQV